MVDIKSKEKLFSFYKDYCKGSKMEIMQYNTINPLLKAFVIETFRSPEAKNLPIQSYFELEPHMGKLTQVDDDLFSLSNSDKFPSYLERINDRFWILYSIDKSSVIDSYVDQLVKKSVYLDNLWISGILFNTLWECLSPIFDPHRYIKMSFEYEDYFNTPEPIRTEDDCPIEEDDIFWRNERRISKISFSEQNKNVETVLPELQKLLSSFNSMGLLRIPSGAGAGGHDFYYSGKVTNRSDDFLGYRGQIKYICNIYKHLTQEVEDEVWFEIEKNTIRVGGEYKQIKGTPVTILFKEELPVNKFQNFINQTFEESSGPFRLWGNPIKLSDTAVHVYGLDMHLWQEVYLELTTKRFTMILPKGTCGNTIHRITTNIQRYLEPKIEVYVGNKEYQDIIRIAIQEGGVQ